MKPFLLFLALALPFSACATDTNHVSKKTSDSIHKGLGDLPIQGVNFSPIKGLYEVQSGGKIYYTDDSGRYIISGGHMFDTTNKQDLTAARVADISRINWSDLPLDQAIVSGPEDGLKMAVFTDPDCPYCKRLESNLKNEKNIRVYTFLYPLTQLHPDAYEKSKSIWCSENQHSTMVDVMLNDKVLPKGTCKTPVDEIIKLAQKLNVMGTPTMFSNDGRKYTGGSITEWLQKGS